mgnify:CR=1 FL=1
MKAMSEWEFHIYMEGFSAYQFQTDKLTPYKSALWRQGWQDATRAEREVNEAEEREYLRAKAVKEAAL